MQKSQSAHEQNLREEQFILLTYRSHIQPILPTSYYTSDSGWGCMLRVGQMFVANLYYKLQKHSKLNVIKLFYDNKPVAFSIQMITQAASKIYPNKKPYQWFSPCEIGFTLKQLIESFDTHYRVSICNDNCLFLSDIKTDREKLIVMLMCRIGLDEPQPEYLQCILKFFKFKHFNSILGGTPKKAHLFLRSDQGYLGYLDPHTTQKVPDYDELPKHQNQYTSKLEWIKQKCIDSSMAITFIVPREEIQDFWVEMQNCKKEVGEQFFIYMQKERPVFNEDEQGIIEIIDDDFD